MKSLEMMQVADWANVHWALWWVYAGEVSPEHRNTSATHSEIAAWYLRAGQVTVRSDTQTISASAGQWLLPWMNRQYLQQFDPSTRILSVRFRLRWVTGEDLFDHNEALLINGDACPGLYSAGMSVADFVARTFPGSRQDLLHRSTTLPVQLRLQRHALAWIEAYVAAMLAAGRSPRLMSQTDDRVVRALRAIDSHPLSEPFREASLARTVGLSVGHLNMLFRSQLKLTPRARFERRREEMAFALVARGSEPFKGIAHRLGFSSQSHFTKWFGLRHGVTPSQARKSHGLGQA